MTAALKNFADLHAAGKMVILGQMGELGKESDEEHGRIIEFLSRANFDEVWLVGENFKKLAPLFRTFNNESEVETALKETPPVHRTILIKGSNRNKLYKLAEIL